MKPQFFAAIHQICDEKNIPYERVLDTVKAALATAYRKDFGNKVRSRLARADAWNRAIVLTKIIGHLQRIILNCYIEICKHDNQEEIDKHIHPSGGGKSI